MTKLFVGGLSYSINNTALNDLFAQFGQVTSAAVITDKFTNQSKGFGFVEMENDSEAQEAIQKLDGSELEGRRLGVSVAKPREDRPQSSNSGFNGGRRDNKPGFGDNRNNFKKGRRF